MVLGFVITAVVILLILEFIIENNKKKIRFKLEKETLEKIIERNVFAKKFIRLYIVLLILGPLPLSYILVKAEGKTIENIIIIVILCFVIYSIVKISYYWNLEGITRILIKERKTKEKN